MIDLTKLSDLEILTLTIIGEARGEPIQGQVAVGSVVRNRVNRYHSSYVVECLKPKQFSCWNKNDPNYQMLIELAEELVNDQYFTDPYLVQCMYVAEGITSNQVLDNTHGALNYMTTDLFFSKSKPSWAMNVTNAKTIGNQIFFNV